MTRIPHTASRIPQFRSVVLDVDSTLCGVEGVDWLATRRGPEIARRTRELTDRAMNGEIALEAVYGDRLAVIQPSRADVNALAQVYRETIAPGASDAIAALRNAGLRVVLVSGGLRQAIAPLAAELGVELHAVDVRWNAAGEYSDFDAASPLTTQTGKVDVVRGLALPGPVLAIGDGVTDLAMRQAVDTFVAFTGFVTRENVVRESDGVIATFAEMAALALGQASS